MRNLKHPAIVVFCTLAVAAAFLIVAARHATAPIPERANAPEASSSYVEVRGARIAVAVAATEVAREQGLSGRESLGNDSGMLFLFQEAGSYGFWMKDMRFPIDIVWIASGTVVGWEANVDPQIGAAEGDLKIYYPPRPVNTVLELAAGKAASLGLTVGDHVIEHVE